MQSLCEGLRLSDRYVLSRRLGRGGLAETWLATDERADSDVALKILSDELSKSAQHRELFRKEWQIASRLMHAHIVRVFEYYDEPERPFFAMQYVDGEHLGVLANEPLGVALPPVTLLADALRYAHAKPVVHGDLKSSNVLLDRRGSPHLIDFGVAAAASGGSPINQSPAQRSGAAPEPADDVYALGVLLHELIAAHPPPQDAADVPARRGNGETVPEGLRRLVGRMLSPSAAARPTAEAVAEALTSLGFAGGLTARAGRRSAERLPAEEEIAVAKVTPINRDGAPETASSGGGDGVSVRAVYAGAAVSVLALAAVVFLLPKSAERDAGSTAPVAQEPIDAPESADAVDAADSTPVADALAAKPAADEALGDLLSQLERLEYRGIERWGGQPYRRALEVYAEGDRAYVDRDYVLAGERYRQTLEMIAPFFSQIEERFREAMAAGGSAFLREDFVEAIRQYELAAAITPNNAEALRGLERARNLEAVLDLVSQGDQYRSELALAPAELAYQKALELDPEWEPAQSALAEVRVELAQQSFEARMTEGFSALAARDYASARAAFDAAKRINPDSREPVDGLLQLDQEVRLARIQSMEDEARRQEESERWETAVSTYEALLDVDGDLQFAQEGLRRAKARTALHQRLQSYIDAPDSLSDPTTMQQATETLLSISRMESVGPRLTDEKDELSRLLKRAATPLTVELVSDNATEVSVYRVGKLGTFRSREISLRPGSYVAVGVRPGYRDVRLEFRVAPELEPAPIVVRCEEPI